MVSSVTSVSLREEVTELLQELIRVDTTNPPGNETAAAELLRAYLEDNGVAPASVNFAQEPLEVLLSLGRRWKGVDRVFHCDCAETL